MQINPNLQCNTWGGRTAGGWTFFHTVAQFTVTCTRPFRFFGVRKSVKSSGIELQPLFWQVYITL